MISERFADELLVVGPNNHCLSIINLEPGDGRRQPHVTEKSCKLMAHRFPVLCFEVIILKKFPHVGAHQIRRHFPFTFEDLLDQIIGNDQP